MKKIISISLLIALVFTTPIYANTSKGSYIIINNESTDPDNIQTTGNFQNKKNINQSKQKTTTPYAIDKVLPEYLMLWFSRTEFQRYTWYYAAGSVRDTFDFNLMQQVEFPIPDIEIQQDIVNIFETYNTRRDINEKLKEQIKDICPILIKGSIEEARKAKEA